MTQLDVTAWTRKTFGVKAVRVTADNLEAVAAWCHGEVYAEGDAVVRFVDCRRAPRPKRVTARVGEWITAEFVDDETVWSKSTSFKVYKDERFIEMFDPVMISVVEVDPDIKKALNELFFESTEAQHLATLSGDKYEADDIHASVIGRILELFEPKVGLTFEQKRDRARVTAKRVISERHSANGLTYDPSATLTRDGLAPLSLARKIADAVVEELYG